MSYSLGGLKNKLAQWSFIHGYPELRLLKEFDYGTGQPNMLGSTDSGELEPPTKPDTDGFISIPYSTDNASAGGTDIFTDTLSQTTTEQTCDCINVDSVSLPKYGMVEIVSGRVIRDRLTIYVKRVQTTDTVKFAVLADTISPGKSGTAVVAGITPVLYSAGTTDVVTDPILGPTANSIAAIAGGTVGVYYVSNQDAYTAVGVIVRGSAGSGGSMTIENDAPKVYCPSTTFEGWYFGFLIHNTSSTALEVDLTFWDEDGNYGTYHTASIPAKGMWSSSTLNFPIDVDCSGGFDDTLNGVIYLQVTPDVYSHDNSDIEVWSLIGNGTSLLPGDFIKGGLI